MKIVELPDGAVVTGRGLRDGKLVGSLVARYAGGGSDSVMTGRQEATRQ